MHKAKEALGLDKLDANDSLWELGLDSLRAAGFAVQVC